MARSMTSERLAGKLDLHLDGEDSAAVLRQVGLHPLPVRSTPLSLDVGFEGALASAGKLTLKGTVAGVDVDYAAETRLRDGGMALSGALTAKSADIDPVLLLGGIAVPGVGEGHAASAKGVLDYSADGVSLALDEGMFAGEPVGGNLQLKLTPDIALSGALELKDASLPFLAALAAGSAPGSGEKRLDRSSLCCRLCRRTSRSMFRSLPRASISAHRFRLPTRSSISPCREAC